MAPKKMKTVVWSSVPEEIVFEILLRLPVKSVCRFRCVSKSWFSVISDPKFISLHFEHSLANPKMLLISVPTTYSSPNSSYELVCSVDYAEWGIKKWRGQPQSLIADYQGLIPHDRPVARPCNTVGGLSLAENRRSNTLLICNPSTRESIRFNLPAHPGDDIRDCLNTSYLGFDPVEKKYKVLSSWIHGMNLSECLNYVITLGEDAWRSVECKYSNDLYFDSVNNICIDGVIYYLLRDGRSVNLVGFDVCLETFTSISAPLDIRVKERPILMEYGGCVAIVYIRDRNNYDKDAHQEIVMAILTDNEKWKCEEYFVPRDQVLPLGRKNYLKDSSRNGELVFVSHEGSNLVKLDCYDLRTKHMKEIKVRAPKDRKCTWSDFVCVKACSHVERLHSLQGLSPAFYHCQRY